MHIDAVIALFGQFHPLALIHREGEAVGNLLGQLIEAVRPDAHPDQLRGLLIGYEGWGEKPLAVWAGSFEEVGL